MGVKEPKCPYKQNDMSAFRDGIIFVNRNRASATKHDTRVSRSSFDRRSQVF